MGKLIIQAMNVHVGGGASLLRLLLESLPPERSAIVLLDERMVLPVELPKNLEIKEVEPTLKARLRAEYWLRTVVTEHDVVLCFGNLPPLFNLKGSVVLFLQNRLLIDRASLRAFPLRVRLRLYIERFWLSHFALHANSFIVQTASMQRLLASKLRIAASLIRVCPFAKINNSLNYSHPKTAINETTTPFCDIDFIYPASGDPHKNHRNLIEAWSILASWGLFPSLYLTLDKLKHPELCSLIAIQSQRFELKIFNFGFLAHEELLRRYQRAQALIYPSLIESFGLPLIEAREAGLSIVAAELDYVRDLLDPVEVFDPSSPLSIARAVRRFIAKPRIESKLFSPGFFWEQVLSCSGMQHQRQMSEVS